MSPREMEYTRLGKSDLVVSKIILGCMSFGSKEWSVCDHFAHESGTDDPHVCYRQEWVLEEAEALPVIKHAWDKGVNTWDTVSFELPSVSSLSHSKSGRCLQVARPVV